MLIVDKLGWPIEKYKGRPVVNFLRTIIHGRKIWGNIKDFNIVMRHRESKSERSPDVTCSLDQGDIQE